MQEVLEKSDHLMAEAKDLFVDFPRRRTGNVFRSNKSFFFLLIIAYNGCLEELENFFRASHYL